MHMYLCACTHMRLSWLSWNTPLLSLLLPLPFDQNGKEMPRDTAFILRNWAKFGHRLVPTGKSVWRHRKKAAVSTPREGTGTDPSHGSQEKPTQPTLWSWTSSCERVSFCCLIPPVCRTLLWKSEQTNTQISISSPRHLILSLGLSSWIACIWTT